MPGLFVTFEGGEGSGKTTQINKLSQTLSNEGRKVLTTREPGGTAEGEKLRNLLVQRDGGNWNPMSECLLLFAARSMHVEKIIKPALESGKIVVSDRFTDSTRAYQGYGHGMEISTIEQMNTLVLGDFKPDLTIILDIEPAAGLERSERRLAGENFMGARSEDRFEKLDLEFHKKLRNGFLSIAQSDPKRCTVIDATQDLETISKLILSAVKGRL
jgi:dTMP kinase